MQPQWPGMPQDTEGSDFALYSLSMPTQIVELSFWVGYESLRRTEIVASDQWQLREVLNGMIKMTNTTFRIIPIFVFN